ncbi:MAG: LemA family protein [Tepidisphaeraceae bacterium]
MTTELILGAAGAISAGLIVAGVVVLVVIVLVLWIVSAYNKLVALRETVRSAWAQIDVLLKRRYDLIPNLVETVKGYATHERGTLEAVIAARNAAVTASSQGNVGAVSQAEGQLQGAMRQLFAVAEAYPDLKANANFMQLQGELGNTENQIAGQRSSYNEIVRQYNTTLMSIPTNFIAGPFGFTPQAFFEVQDPGQREAPQVKFG